MAYEELTPKRLKSAAKASAKHLFQKIDDPVDRVDNDFVYTKKPRTKSQSFGGYPYIHIDGVNIINSNTSADGTLVNFTVDIEVHAWGTEESIEDVENHDEIVDQIIYLLTGPEKATLQAETGMTQPNIIRNVDFTGIREKDQPVTRQEIEFRTTIHKVMA